MKLHRQIRVQKLQDKNRMIGQTFNPGGHTSESLAKRENDYVQKCKLMTVEELTQEYSGYKEWEEYKFDNRIYASNSFEHNVFMRHFGWQFK